MAAAAILNLTESWILDHSNPRTASIYRPTKFDANNHRQRWRYGPIWLNKKIEVAPVAIFRAGGSTPIPSGLTYAQGPHVTWPWIVACKQTKDKRIYFLVNVPPPEAFFSPKCTKYRLAAGLRPDPLGELTALPDSLMDLGGVLLREGGAVRKWVEGG